MQMIGNQPAMYRDLPRSLQAAERQCAEVVSTTAVAAEDADPEGALARWLLAVQRRQQARFAALPEAVRRDEWVQLCHDRLLRQNQEIHDAARESLRVLAALKEKARPARAR